MGKKASRKKKRRLTPGPSLAQAKLKQPAAESVKPPRTSRTLVWVGAAVAAAAVLVVLGTILSRLGRTPHRESPGRSIAEETPPVENPMFTDVTKQSGITFRHSTGDTGRLLYPEIMGSGVALFDYDGDNDLDIYFLNGN